MNKRTFAALLLAVAIGTSACGNTADEQVPEALQTIIETREMVKDQVVDLVKDTVGDKLPFLSELKDEMDDWEPDFDTENLFYFNTLGEEEQKAYLRLVHGIEQTAEEIKMREKINADEELEIMKAITADLPQLFWITGSSSYTYESATGKVITVNPEYNSLAESLEMNKEAFEAAKAPFLRDLEGKSDVEKERIIHDRLAQNVEYVSESEENQTAFSAIVSGKTVCAGYTRAFQYLMNEAGIPCYWCQGESLDPSKAEKEGENAKWEAHSWNKILLGGDCYLVDVTWDDTQFSDEGLICYNYFNVTDDEVKKSHKADEDGRKLPACTATEYSFEKVYGHSASMELLDQMGIADYLTPENLQEYYDMSKEAFARMGKGEHTITFVMHDRALLDAIDNSFNKKGYEKGFMNAVVKKLKMNGYRYSISYESTIWTDDLIVMRQTLRLSDH